MVNYAYQNAEGKKVTQTGYDAQVKVGNDVSGFSKIGTEIPTTPITAGITTPESIVPGITDEMKNTDTYKELLNKGFTEDQISSAVSKHQSKKIADSSQTPETPVTTIETPQAAPTPDTAEQGNDSGHPDYKSDTPERLQDIVTNLDSYKTTNPNLFNDIAKYKDFFHYNERSQAQKDVLNNYFSQHNKPSLDIFGGLTESQIGDGYINGTFTDSDLLGLKNTDPNKRQLTQTYINKQKTYDDANGSINGALKSVKQIIGAPTTPADSDFVGKYDEYLNTPEIKGLQGSLNDKKGELDKLDQQIRDMRITTEAQYKGTGINGDVLDAVVADRQEALTRDKTRKEIAYNTELNKYNGLVQIGEGKYQAYKDDIEQKRQERQDNLSQLDFYYGSTPEGIMEMTQITGGGAQEILTKDFGTAKSPQRKQSLDGGKTRQDIAGVGGYGGGAGGGGGGGLYGGGYGGGSGTGGKYLEEVTSLMNWGRNARMASGVTQFAPVGAGAETATKVGIFKFLKKNLTLDKFVDLKGKGATFGAMSDAEWEIISDAATKLNRNMSDAAWNAELTKIYNAANRLGSMVENADGSITIKGKTYKTPDDVKKGIYTTSGGTNSGGDTNTNTNTDTNTSNNSYGLDFGSIFTM